MQIHKLSLDKKMENLNIDRELRWTQQVWCNNMNLMLWFMKKNKNSIG
jgi:hypothetical protein